MTKSLYNSVLPNCPDRTLRVVDRRAGTLALGLICLSAASVGSPLSVFAQTPPTPSPPATVTLHLKAVRQPMYGFGGSQTYAGDALADFPQRDAVYKALFQDLKIDIFRLRNYDGYPGEQAKFDRITRDFAGGARRFGGDPKTRGGKPPVRLMFTSWSPPPALKSNGRVSGRSDGTEQGRADATLKKAADGKFAYGDFADWWLDSLTKFKSLTGSYPDYIALQNELDFPATYEGCLFAPSESANSGGVSLAGYREALKAVSDRLTGALGTQAPKIVGPETFSVKTNLSDPNHVLRFVDPTTTGGKDDLTHLFGVSFHLYGAGAAGGDGGSKPELLAAGLNGLRDAYQSNGVDKPLFQTEFLGGESLTTVAGIINDTFTEANASAYLVWIAARDARGPGYALVYFNSEDGSIERRERFYAVKAFSEYIGEGWHRIDADCPDTAIKLSAYVGPTPDDLVTVLINPTGQAHRIAVLPDDSRFAKVKTSVHRSSDGESGEHWRDLGPLLDGGVVTLTPHSVVTVRFVHP